MWGNEVILRAMQRTFSFLLLVLASCAIVPAADGARGASQDTGASVNPIRGEEHYVIRDGLRIYLWEKHKVGLEGTFASNGKVALLVHGGTWPGRPDFDLQIRDYSLMDFLASHDDDVWRPLPLQSPTRPSGQALLHSSAHPRPASCLTSTAFNSHSIRRTSDFFKSLY